MTLWHWRRSGGGRKWGGRTATGSWWRTPREEILRVYREGGRKKRAGGRSVFLEKDKDAEEEAVRKLQEAAGTEP